MKQWAADFVNDPYDDYNLMVEILYNNEDVAVIKKGKEGLEIRLHPNSEEMTIPLDWLVGLLQETKKRLME